MASKIISAFLAAAVAWAKLSGRLSSPRLQHLRRTNRLAACVLTCAQISPAHCLVNAS